MNAPCWPGSVRGGYRRYRAADRAIRVGTSPATGHGPEVITFVVVALSIVLVALYLVNELR